MNLDWLEGFADPYLKTPFGQGVFLGGIILGMVAKYQVNNDDDIDSAPMFKQIMFGKMQRRDLLRHLSRVPELLRAYDIPYNFYVQQLARKAGDLLLQGSGEMGVDGNFVFSVAFLNASEYFWRIFGRPEEEKLEDEERGE
ncbi:TM1802 family CRISPR-associated protein [Thermincola potens]|uniref:CRISPR-associated protein n=1 Tax=Thermincola potens (strain JR) TaxID=635013 RepID=D5XAX7_THEPJ|nr:TM1802 family CRISPR-associated protein [Thermincola potens]ADG83331.1 conserved hypothetical protein [Thermincola potens JR]